MVQQAIRQLVIKQNHVLLKCKEVFATAVSPLCKYLSSLPQSAKKTKSAVNINKRIHSKERGKSNSIKSSNSSCADVGMIAHENAMPSIIHLAATNSLSSARIGGEILRSGGIIATPTDTVYGLAANAQNIEAVAKLYEIKGRNPEKPIAICVSEINQLSTWAKITVSNDLLQDFLPGPVTLVFERKSALNKELNPETNLIGIRIPNHTFIRQLAEEHAGPIALTSANPSSQPSTLSPDEFRSLWPYLDCVFDGGDLRNIHPNPSQVQHSNNNLQDADERIVRAGSTVINLSHAGHFSIIREGSAYKTCVQLLREKYHLVEKKDS